MTRLLDHWAAQVSHHHHDLTLRLSLFVLLLHPGSAWYMSIPLIAITCLGLLIDKVRNQIWYWLSILALLCFTTLYVWFYANNYRYLLVYWGLCLVLAGLPKVNGPRLLQVSSRVLLGLTFAFAVTWKIISPDFLSGRYFHYALLEDTRFNTISEQPDFRYEILSHYWGSLSRDAIAHNQSQLQQIRDSPRPQSSYALNTSPQLQQLAAFLTAFVLLEEILIAAVFLGLLGPRLGQLRDYALLLFIVSTYWVAPAFGFGNTLVTLGFAQASSPRTKLFYLAAFFLLIAYTLPLDRGLDWLLGRLGLG